MIDFVTIQIVSSNLFEKVNFCNDEIKYQNNESHYQKIVTRVRGIGSVAHKKRYH